MGTGNARPKPSPPESDGRIESLFSAHHALVLRSAYRLTGNLQDAQDVLQTIFLRLARQPELLDRLKDNPAAYLRRAATNAALDVLRSRNRHQEAELDAGLASKPLDGDLARALGAALAALPPRLALVWTLRCVEGLTTQETAAAAGVPTLSVAVMVYRARQRLRRALHGWVSPEGKQR